MAFRQEVESFITPWIRISSNLQARGQAMGDTGPRIKKWWAKEFLCIFNASPNLFPRPLRHPQEGAGAALLLGCAGWGEQRRIPSPSPFPFAGTRNIRNKRASHQAPALDAEAVGRHGTGSQGSRSCWVVLVPSRVQSVHSPMVSLQGWQTASAGTRLRSHQHSRAL